MNSTSAKVLKAVVETRLRGLRVNASTEALHWEAFSEDGEPWLLSLEKQEEYWLNSRIMEPHPPIVKSFEWWDRRK
jgi:hypothetical protein